MIEQLVITRADIEAVASGVESWRFDTFWKELGNVVRTIAQARHEQPEQPAEAVDLKDFTTVVAS